MTKAPERYPLAWPKGRPRRKASERMRGDFVFQSKRIQPADAMDRLETEIERLGGQYPLLSSNLELRMDGRPRIDRGQPTDPAVCVYFTLKGQAMAMGCDAYTEVGQNIAAIANHIDAVRRIARYGVATAEEVLSNFQALPPPPAGGSIQVGAAPAVPWWEYFNLIRETAEEDAVGALYRHRAKSRASDPDKLLELNLQRDAALAEIRGRS